MKKQFLPEITYMRGLCMLGVIAIHVGSFAVTSDHFNLQFVAIMEIASRFSIPTFFFLSSFGLFYHHPTYKPFSYKDFMKRRFKVIAIPYLVWSFLYLLYNSFLLKSVAIFFPQYLIPTLFFGTACYQLYFITIIMWFYIFMPFWRKLATFISKKPVFWMSLLFIIQTLFNYFSSYHMSSIHLSNPLLQYFIDMRLNYWVLHYVWVWMLGALIAERYDAALIWIHRNELLVVSSFLMSMAAMFAAFYYVIFNWGYSPISAINTIHQLSPFGMVFTATTIPFLIYAFHKTSWREEWRIFWNEMGLDSFGMYLVHPFLLIVLTHIITKLQWQYNPWVIFGLYVTTITLSARFTIIVRQAPINIRKYLLGK